MAYWYIFFVKTGRELVVEKRLKNNLNPGLHKPFVPKLKTISKISGLIKIDTALMFPSYVFIESQLSSIEFNMQRYEIVRCSKDIISLLSYGDMDETALREDECQLLSDLLNNEKCVETSKGIIIGDRVYIKEGPLVGRESIIKKINRHKRRAIIELDLMGTMRNVHVALEIVEKI